MVQRTLSDDGRKQCNVGVFTVQLPGCIVFVSPPSPPAFFDPFPPNIYFVHTLKSVTFWSWVCGLVKTHFTPPPPPIYLRFLVNLLGSVGVQVSTDGRRVSLVATEPTEKKRRARSRSPFPWFVGGHNVPAGGWRRRRLDATTGWSHPKVLLIVTVTLR